MSVIGVENSKQHPLTVSITVLGFVEAQEVREGRVYQYVQPVFLYFFQNKPLTNLICHFLVALSDAEFQ